MQTLGTMSDLVDPTILELFSEVGNQLSSELMYKKLGYTDYTPSNPNPQFSNSSGLSAAQLTLEGQPYREQDKVQGYNVTITPLKYTTNFTITEEVLNWITNGNKEYAQEFRDDSTAVVQSLYERIDTQAARMLYLAHTTTHQTGGDGVALAAYNHPSTEPGVAVQRNIPTTAEGHVALSYTALVNARVRLNRFYDLKGVQMRKARRLKLLVGAENYDLALRLTQSQYLPGTDNNDINTVQNIDVEVVEYQPAAYGFYWALVDPMRMARAAKMVWNWKPRVNAESTYANGTYSKLASVALQSGFSNWSWAYFSKGDGSVVSN